MLGAMSTPAPRWFTSPPHGPGEPDVVAVDGVDIAHRVWGDAVAPGLVLVHGGAGHLQWWAPLAGLLADRYRVIALDLSGHGDSGWRERYDLGRWCEEVMAVAGRHLSGPATIVGHSMGGAVAAACAVRHGHDLGGVIVLDAPVWRDTAEVHQEYAERSFSRLRTYPTREEAVGRFRLVPEQPCPNPWFIRHVATHSVREVDGGWTWKFDPRVFSARDRTHLRADEFGGHLHEAVCPLAMVIGARSYLANDPFPQAVRRGEPVAGSATSMPLHEVADAAHHLLLDQPVAVAQLISRLAAWDRGDAQSA